MAWDGVECIECNTEITGYTVHSMTHVPVMVYMGEVSASGMGNSGGNVTFTELSPSTSYSIEVAADIGEDCIPFNNTISVVTSSESLIVAVGSKGLHGMTELFE